MKEYKFKIGGKEYNVTVNPKEGKLFDVTVNGATYEVESENAPVAAPAAKNQPAKPKKEKKGKKAALATVKAGEIPGEVAAAIALAMDMEQGGDDYAAIAMALHLYFSDAVHDTESFILTMRPKEGSAWNDKKQIFRKLPR